MRWPWITREHHLDVCQQFETRLAAAAERVSEAEQRAFACEQERRSLSEQLIERMLPKPHSDASPQRKANPQPTMKVEVPLDPYDMPALVKQAYRETGNRNPRAVMARAQRMQDNMLRGHPETRTRIMPAPAEVQRIIDEAEQAGTEEALREQKAG